MRSHKYELAKDIHQRLGTTDEILKEWEHSTYPVDGRTISKVWENIQSAKQVIIVGDYDVDGICASHILSTSIRKTYPGKKVKVRIPRRFSEGYGINDTIADEIIETMPVGSLVITVDNGISAAPVLNRLKEAGYTVIVTDHHQKREGMDFPEVDILIDPSVADLENPFTGNYWCGAGIAYKLSEPMISEELSEELLTYAGLATVADCMELKEGNWGLVRNALKIFRAKKAPEALKMLMTAMNQDSDFCKEDDFGFYLGPAFNAPGRLLDKGAVEVLKFLYHPTQEGCDKIITLNETRKTLRDEETERVITYLEESGHANDCPIWVAMPGLHEGIVGIIAGQISEHYKKPAIVLTNTETPGLLKGSGRSYGNFDIFAYLSSMNHLFTKMGGHPGAAGLSMTEESFKTAQTSYPVPVKDIKEDEDTQTIRIAIDKWEIPGLAQVLDKFRPFGQGNPAPEFDIQVDMNEDEVKMLGSAENHLCICGPKVNPKNPKDFRRTYKIMHFNHIPNELENPSRFGMCGTINGSVFRGDERPQFTADEIYDIVDSREKGR